MDERLRFVARLLDGEKMATVWRRVWDLAQDWLQDLRPLQGLRRPRAVGPQPAALPACEPAPAGLGNADCPAEEGLPRPGCT